MPTVKVKNQENEASPEAERMAELNEMEGGELYKAIDEARSTQGAEVILTRTMPADKAGFCDKIPVAEFDLTMIKSKYGPGTYRVRFNGPTGFLPGGSTIKIAATPEKPAATAADPLTFFEMMERREAERRERTNDWLKIAVPSVVGLITAFISRPASNDIAQLVTALKPAPGPTLQDLSATMVNLQTLGGGNAKESQVDMILKVFESAQTLMGGGGEGKAGEGSNWVDVIRDLIKAAPDAIKPMLEARMAAMQGVHSVQQVKPALAPNPSVLKPAPTPAAPPLSTASASTAENVTGEDNMRALWEPIAKQHLAKVFGWAEKNRDPEIYAEVFFDELPPLGGYLTLDQVLEHMQNPQWFEKICELEPRLATHREFCDEMRQALLEIVKDLKSDEAEQPQESAASTQS